MDVCTLRQFVGAPATTLPNGRPRSPLTTPAKRGPLSGTLTTALTAASGLRAGRAGRRRLGAGRIQHASPEEGPALPPPGCRRGRFQPQPPVAVVKSERVAEGTGSPGWVASLQFGF